MKRKRLPFKETLKKVFAEESEEFALISELFEKYFEETEFASSEILRKRVKTHLKRKLRGVAELENTVPYYLQCLEREYDQWGQLVRIAHRYNEIITSLISHYKQHIPGLAEMSDEDIAKECRKFQRKLDKQAEKKAAAEAIVPRSAEELEEMFREIERALFFQEEEEAAEEELKKQQKRDSWL